MNEFNNDYGGAFHHCMTENCLLRVGASVLLPVTPRRTTGFNGLSAHRMYGFHWSGGAPLCAITMD